jgi:hypothetical protein
MKIAMLAVSATAFLHLKGPDGALLYDGKEKVGIELYGPGSPDFARVEERQTARAIKRMQDNDNKVSLAPIEDRRSEATEDLAALTADFRHIEHEDADGKLLAGGALHAAVYSDPGLGWIKEQVTKFVGDWGKFKPGSAGI